MNRRKFLAGGMALSLPGVSGCIDSISSVFDSQSPLTVSGEWPRPEFDSGSTGQNKSVEGPVNEPEVRWEADAPIDSMHTPAIVVSDGIAFFAGGSVVTAFDITDGSQKWQTKVADVYLPSGGRGKHCSITIFDEYVFVGTHEGMVCLTKDGEKVWSHDVTVVSGYSGVFRSPAVIDEKVYFCTAEDQSVFSYTIDGNKEWEYKLDNPLIGAPAVTDDGVFVAESSGGLHAISTNGDRLWEKDIGATSANGAMTPTVFEGTVYASGHNSQQGTFLAAFDTQTGDEEWSNNLAPSFSDSLSIIEHDSFRGLACPTWDGMVFLYDLRDGSIKWGSPLGGRPSDSVLIPSADKQSVYVAGVNSITRLVPMKDRDWQIPLDSVSGSIAILEKAILVGSTDSTCYALS